MSGARFLIVLLALAAAQARGQYIQYTDCKTFKRGAEGTVVKSYFEKSQDAYLQVCNGGHSVSSGSPISVRDGVCVFLSRTPRISGWETDRAVIMMASEPAVQIMAEFNGSCPTHFSNAYAVTEGVSPAAYASMMASWGSSISSVERFDAVYSNIGGGASKADVQSLRRIVMSGRSKGLNPFRVQRTLKLGVVNHYELHVEDPDIKGRVFVFLMTEWFGSVYTVSQLSIAII